METIDSLNVLVRACGAPIWSGSKAWEMKLEMLSLSYAASWREIPRAG